MLPAYFLTEALTRLLDAVCRRLLRRVQAADGIPSSNQDFVFF
jgi:hypothetical protein